jgi:hypothetical protein
VTILMICIDVFHASCTALSFRLRGRTSSALRDRATSPEGVGICESWTVSYRSRRFHKPPLGVSGHALAFTQTDMTYSTSMRAAASGHVVSVEQFKIRTSTVSRMIA